MYHKLQYKKSKQPPKCTGLFILDKRISIHSSSNKPLHFSGSLDFFYCITRTFLTWNLYPGQFESLWNFGLEFFSSLTVIVDYGTGQGTHCISNENTFILNRFVMSQYIMELQLHTYRQYLGKILQIVCFLLEWPQKCIWNVS